MEVFSPAKLNLYLAVTGLREDGFHNLESLIFLVGFGDVLRVEKIRGDSDQYECDSAELDWSEANIMRRAVELYRKRTSCDFSLRIQHEKRIPLGSGMGGGSSNASTILKVINTLNEHSVDLENLSRWSSELGSDCPLFFEQSPCWISGRGEKVERFDGATVEVLRGKRVLIFNPGFPISAVWAYKKLVESESSCATSIEIAQQHKEALKKNSESLDELIGRNDLSLSVDQKYLAIPTLFEAYKREFSGAVFMSGSGSSCFVLLDDEDDADSRIEFVRNRWGRDAFVCETFLDISLGKTT